MSQQVFPSTAFPAYPTIKLSPPAGWTHQVVPDAVGALMAPASEGRYTPNVVISVSRRLPGYQLQDIAASVDSFLDALPDAVLLGTEPVVINGRDWYVREARYTHPQAGSLTQFTAVTVVHQDAASDIVQLTGSCQPSEGEDLKAIYSLVASADITPAS
ncbi:hypothetical protein HAV21_16495 [Paenarthrobacter sp. MSM-2-10-13]|uniref:hypothetical protein n=1 Tax=Micrococcaceae TaxID=1268 RepID=UPI00115F6F37|nr:MULTISPECIES: hypothetical protein [Micrococcaceae]MCM0618420.1 hypothetical protein [Paenarthrobacter sp. TYUT067]NHW48475.1 hypothetical protein [Paenarthrobacter sp. MSM-2-10-13]TQS93383.1 hypothetical protein EU811_05970 [Arthrobacter sp. TS-15]BCW64920.1 hypothetical protein StoSoilB22_38930 [Arthrobacter sp. StoSoilB22]